MEKLLLVFIVLVFMLGSIGVFVLAVRWARKSSRRAAFLGWGLQLSVWSSRSGIPSLARHRRVKGVTLTRLPDSSRSAVESVATSVWQ
jgi:hypothetical protein